MPGLSDRLEFGLIRRWGRRGFWAIADQAAFAASNFLLNVLLARWLEVQDYGAFAVAFTGFLFLATFHGALIIEPMLVFGPGKYAHQFGRYLRVLLRAHLVVTLVIGGLLAGTALVFELVGDSNPLVPTLFALAGAGPFVLYQWLMRRSCYVHLEPRTAAFAGIGYVVVVTIGAFALSRLDALSPVTAIVLMGFASYASGLFIERRMGLPKEPAEAMRPFAREVVAEHWGYGRWAVPAAALTWVPGNLFYVTLPFSAGLEATAVLRALTNLTVPMYQFTTSLGILLLPAMSRALARGDMGRVMRASLLGLIPLSVAYYLLIAVFAEPILTLLYADQYREYAWLVWIIGLRPVTKALNVVLGASLRARVMPQAVFYAYVVSAVFTAVVAGLTLTTLGITGGAIGMTAASLTTAMAMVAFIALGRRPSAAPPNGAE